MRVHSRPSVLQLYVAVISVAAAVLLLDVVVTSTFDAARSATAFAGILAVLVVVGELRPVIIPFRDEAQEVSTSTAFVFALLLLSGLALAAPVQALATAVADVRAGRPKPKIAFNVGQLVLSLAAADVALRSIAGREALAVELSPRQVLAFLGAAGVYFVLNNTLVAIAVSLSQHTHVTTVLRSDLSFQVSTAVILLTLAPLLVAAGRESLLFMPFFAPVILAVYGSAKMSVDKQHRALHDALTGLANRTRFRDRVQALLAHAPPDAVVAVMLLDLDYFKDINDTLGHHIGDVLLRGIASRLEEAVGEDGLVARLGGDEFAVLATAADRAAVRALAERLLDAVREPFALNDLTFHVEASIGAALHPDDANDCDVLLQRADVAMYVAKAARNGFEFYSPERDEYSPKRLALLGDLRRAITDRQFVLHYQPKAELPGGVVTGVECLLRWNHPEHGLVMPDDFIPLAEPTGIIAPLTAHAVDLALAQCAAWRDQGLRLGVSVNVSVRNLYDPQFPDDVRRLLAVHDVDADQLDLEITESAVMADPKRAVAVLERLSAMGVHLTLDDFGTGYSSLAYLKRLPVDEMKIDKSFVINMAWDDDDNAIVASTIDLARSLGLRVVAEGVESELVWRQLVELGCHAAQGYYLSRPVPAEQLLVWLLQLGRDRCPLDDRPAPSRRPADAPEPGRVRELQRS